MTSDSIIWNMPGTTNHNNHSIHVKTSEAKIQSNHTTEQLRSMHFAQEGSSSTMATLTFKNTTIIFNPCVLFVNFSLTWNHCKMFF